MCTSWKRRQRSTVRTKRGGAASLRARAPNDRAVPSIGSATPRRGAPPAPPRAVAAARPSSGRGGGARTARRTPSGGSWADPVDHVVGPRGGRSGSGPGRLEGGCLRAWTCTFMHVHTGRQGPSVGWRRLHDELATAAVRGRGWRKRINRAHRRRPSRPTAASPTSGARTACGRRTRGRRRQGDAPALRGRSRGPSPVVAQPPTEHPAWRAEPNDGHRALVELERQGRLVALLTQKRRRTARGAAGHDPRAGGRGARPPCATSCASSCGERGAPMARALERVAARGRDDPSWPHLRRHPQVGPPSASVSRSCPPTSSAADPGGDVVRPHARGSARRSACYPDRQRRPASARPERRAGVVIRPTRVRPRWDGLADVVVRGIDLRRCSPYWCECRPSR